jgi:formylglycine-generating enzyme required for sulfatase activity
MVRFVSKGMVLVPGGSFVMGSLDFYPEERPPRRAEAPDLWFDEHPVTNAQFRRFVADTGYLTVAEQAPDPADFPGADPADLVPGSQLFVGTDGPVPLDNWMRWWTWAPGASWRHPEGPSSTLHGRDLHPVVHVGFEDAAAYARWAGKQLPTEVAWERAARGGLDRATYPWGEQFMPDGKIMANTWHGRFPYENLRPHGFTRTSPVKKFPPNGFGLFDVAGNVWEWTTSLWSQTHDDPGREDAPSCCAPVRPLTEGDRRVTKGGSHLCAPSYCHRYRPAARQAHAVRSTTSHLGFRCCRPA